MSDKRNLCYKLISIGINPAFLTEKQLRQFRIALELFPELVIGNESFRQDLYQFVLEKNNKANGNRCRGNLLNDLFRINDLNENKIIKFKGYGNGISDITYIFYKDGTSNRIDINQWNCGESNIKFMPFKTTRSISLLDDKGRTMYVREQKDIRYIKFLSRENEQLEIIIDPKRSGIEKTEILFIAQDKYLKFVIDKKKQRNYYWATNSKEYFNTYDSTLKINQGEYEDVLDSCLLIRKKH